MNTENGNELNPNLYTPEEFSDKVADITFEQVPENTFRRWGIMTKRVLCNGRRTGVVLIRDLLNGGFWKATERYQVIPHQMLMRIVEQVADELGINLTMLEQPALRRGYKTYATHINGNQATITKDGRYMLASMTSDKSVNVSADDKVMAGITVVNTMDSSTAVHIVPMIYTLNCTNQFPAFNTAVKGWQGNTELKGYESQLEQIKDAWSHNRRLQETYPLIEDFVKAITKRHTHVKTLDEQVIAEKVALCLELAVGYTNDYKDLAQTPLTMETAQKIVDGMPVNVNKHLTCVRYTRNRKEHTNEILVPSWIGHDKAKKPTEYDLFNDYTDILTHNEDVASASMMAQLNNYRKIFRLFNFGNRRPIEAIA